ncbi:hypothetical protein FWD07_02490 [Candidatus Saccharibacteria bacterium]|nr:hypothetical protein [Candidatus Saccharibacteria bacterium]
MNPDENNAANDQAAGVPVGSEVTEQSDVMNVSEQALGGDVDVVMPIGSVEQVFTKEDTGKKKKTLVIVIGAVVLLVVGVLVWFLISAYYSDQENGSPVVEVPELTGMEFILDQNEGAERVAIGQTIRDVEMGYEIEVVGMITGIRVGSDAGANDNGVAVGMQNPMGVAVEVRVRNETPFTGIRMRSEEAFVAPTLAIDSLVLVADGDVSRSDRAPFNAMIQEARGIQMMRDVIRGDTLRGWLFFVIDADVEELVFRYMRTEREVVHRDDTGREEYRVIPENNFDIAIRNGSSSVSVPGVGSGDEDED